MLVKEEILSLVGLLQHTTKVVRPGRTFVARIYTTAAKLQKLHFVTRLNKEFQYVSGSWDCKAVLHTLWLQWQWSPEWTSMGIMAKELTPIIFSCVAWGLQLSKKVVNF